MYVGSIRTLKDESPISPEWCRLLTLMGVKIKGSEKLNNVIKQLNVKSQARLPAFSGTGSGIASWLYAPSSNPASGKEPAESRLLGRPAIWRGSYRL